MSDGIEPVVDHQSKEARSALSLIKRQFWSGAVLVAAALLVTVHSSIAVRSGSSLVGLVALGVHAHGSMTDRKMTSDPSGLFVSAGLAGVLIYAVASHLREGRPLMGMNGDILGQVSLLFGAISLGAGIWISYRRKNEMEEELRLLEAKIAGLEERMVRMEDASRPADET